MLRGSVLTPTPWTSTSSIAQGNDAIQLNLLHNYQSNLALYDGWHEFFRKQAAEDADRVGKERSLLHGRGRAGLPARYSESRASPARYRTLCAGGFDANSSRSKSSSRSGVNEELHVFASFIFRRSKGSDIMDFPEKPTVVLVHGAWADGSSWQAVVRPLEDRGLNVIAAPIPLTSLSDDAAALRRTHRTNAGPSDRGRACVCRCGHCHGARGAGEGAGVCCRAGA